MGMCTCGYIMFRAQVCVYEYIYLMCLCGYMCLFSIGCSVQVPETSWGVKVSEDVETHVQMSPQSTWETVESEGVSTHTEAWVCPEKAGHLRQDFLFAGSWWQQGYLLLNLLCPLLPLGGPLTFPFHTWTELLSLRWIGPGSAYTSAPHSGLQSCPVSQDPGLLRHLLTAQHIPQMVWNE